MDISSLQPRQNQLSLPLSFLSPPPALTSKDSYQPHGSNPRKPSSKLIQRLKYIIKLTTSGEFYDKINGPFMDAAKLDGILSTICYSCLFLSEIIKRKPTIVKFFKSVYFKLVSILIKFFKNFTKLDKLTKILTNHHQSFTLIPTQENEKAQEDKEPTADITSSTAIKLRSLSNYLSDVRIFNRMWGLPGLMSFGITDIKTTYESSEKSKIMKILGIIDTISIVAFQPLENIGFSIEHKWTKHSIDEVSSLSEWYYVISCRFWALFVVLEIVKNLKDISDLKSLKKVGVVGLIKLLSLNGDNAGLTRALVANVANLPLTVHWSVFGGCLNDLTVGFFGTWSSLLDTYNTWHEVYKSIKVLEV